jgi:hypothetical protein
VVAVVAATAPFVAVELAVTAGPDAVPLTDAEVAADASVAPLVAATGTLGAG